MRVIVTAIAVLALMRCSPSGPGLEGDVAGEDGSDTPRDEGEEVDDGSRDDAPVDVRPDGDPFPAVCGDGYLDPGEECDDGNRLNGDGCDWLCRVGDGSFDYPDPDPDVPPVASAGPAVEVVPTEEGIEAILDARMMQLVWGGSNYVLAYRADLPFPVVRVRLLDRSGVPAGGPWEVPVAWGSATLAAVRSGDEVDVAIQEAHTGRLLVYRFDSASGPIADPVELAAPDGRSAWPTLLDLAAGRGQLLVACQSWDLSLLSADLSGIVAHGSWGPYLDGADLLTQAIGTPAGFVATNVHRLVAVDDAVSLIGWSGVIPGGPESGTWPRIYLPGTDPVALVDDGLLFWWVSFVSDPPPPAPQELGDLWVAKTDFLGNLVLPPRQVLPDLTHGNHGFGVASGVAGIAVAYSRCLDDSPTPCTVGLVTADSAGNIRSGPFTLMDEGVGLSGDVPVVVAADDEGYAVLAVKGDRDTGDHVLLFRRFVPAP
jgi:cysteine-rich repeat protein